MTRAWSVTLVAAAAIAVGVLVFAGLRAKRLPPPPPFFEHARPIEGAHDSITVPPGGVDTVRLPDGSEIRFRDDANVQFAPPDADDRCIVELWHGDLELRVADAPRRFRLVAPAGEIRFAPGHYRVYGLGVASLPVKPDSRDLPILTVEVHEGHAELENTVSGTTVEAGRLGLSCAGMDPIVRDPHGEPAAWVPQLANMLRPGDDYPVYAFGEEVRAPFVMAMLWGTRAGAAWDWKNDLADPSPEIRLRTALLVGVRGPAAGWEALRERFDRETDPAIRKVLAQGLACTHILHPSPKFKEFANALARKEPDPILKAWAERRVKALETR